MHGANGEDPAPVAADLKGVTAAILAGGLGTRLRGVVRDRPKVLAAVGGRPFLAYLLDLLAEGGVRRGVLCTGYLADQVRREFGDRFRGMELAWSEEPEPRGTGGALRLALPLLGDADVLVMNGDSYSAVDLGAFARFHRAASPLPHASLVVVQVPDTRRFGCVLFDGAGRMTAFREKEASAGSGWINAGIYLLPAELVREIPEGEAVSLEKDMFPRWVERGMFAWRSPGPFLDIGTPSSYRDAQAFFSAGRPPG